MNDVTVTVPFDRYLDYEEMTGCLRSLSEAFPRLMRLESLGKTWQGRDIWAVTLTNPATGSASEKPAYYIDGQIHAEEHATSAVALYAVWHLLQAYGNEAEVTRLLDEQAVYVLPRINPDGAEYALQPPFVPWCGNGRFRPGEERDAGLIPADVDQDGMIASMRVPDPRGEWKVSEGDPRLMTRRGPSEYGGAYYRLYPEGLIRDFDGVSVRVEKPRDGNLNRNFAANWSVTEYGAGDSALSEPESRAVADFIVGHPNIVGMNSYHTHGGVVLRPSMTEPDASMPAEDLALYQDIGAMATRITSYPAVSVYEAFTPDKAKPRRGGLMDWAYHELGIVSLATEVWDIERASGVEKEAFYNLHARDTETERKILEWAVANVGELGFKAWTPFDHPQLGAVEIGGLNSIWTYRNPPPALLPELCRHNVDFCVQHALAAPRLAIDRVDCAPSGEGVFKITASISNHGYLPTHLTQVALDNGVAEPVEAEIVPDGDIEVLSNRRAVVGHLAGRSGRRAPWSPWGPDWQVDARSVEWYVRARSPGQVTIVARSVKAGKTSQRAPVPKEEP